MVDLLTTPVNLYIPMLLRETTRLMMSANFNCSYNCSEHGDCDNGTCVCEVQFNGDACGEPNVSYFVAFATIFFVIGTVSFVQLLLCVRSEFLKMKTPNFWQACRVTTQKALYLLMFLAAGVRGVYFSSSVKAPHEWAPYLLSAYYTILLTGASLIVCFWAEIFHLTNIRWDKPRFLSKSFIGFITFNVLTYSLLIVELILSQFADHLEVKPDFLNHVFNGCYAVLLFIVVIFFLFYGVEVYFKIRGGFASGPIRCIDSAQLHQSRFGLIFQACMLMITVCFLFSEILGQFWKNKVPVLSRNFHDVTFRVVELGVALWFPCVLWNCMSPEQLWILNPKKILKKLELDTLQPHNESEYLVPEGRKISIRKSDDTASQEKLPDCFICYDSERNDAGPLIQPCLCKGDVGAVHHDCLRKWLVESADNPDNLHCKVCKELYELERGQAWLPAGFTLTSWLYTASIVTVMCASAAGAWIIIHMYEDSGVRMLTVGIALLIQYICLKFLGFSAVTAYQRAKVSAIKILGRRKIHINGRTADSSPEPVKYNLTTGLPPMEETRV